ncbi:MAG: hypothetical protein ACI36Z_09285 [Alloprevotella sp.]
MSKTLYDMQAGDGVYFSEGEKCYYRDAFENHVFADGTPFGIKEE